MHKWPWGYLGYLRNLAGATFTVRCELCGWVNNPSLGNSLVWWTPPTMEVYWRSYKQNKCKIRMWPKHLIAHPAGLSPSFLMKDLWFYDPVRILPAPEWIMINLRQSWRSPFCFPSEWLAKILAEEDRLRGNVSCPHKIVMAQERSSSFAFFLTCCFECCCLEVQELELEQLTCHHRGSISSSQRIQ